MPECQSCGGHITEDFARVFGDNDNEAFGCPNCLESTEIMRGAASAEDVGNSGFGREML